MRRATTPLVATLAILATHAVIADDAPVTSVAAHGIVALQPDASLSGDRLAIRLVAKNLGKEAATLDPATVVVHVPEGSRARLLQLDELTAELTPRNADRATRQAMEMHQQESFTSNQNVQVRDRMGNSITTGALPGVGSSTVMDGTAGAVRPEPIADAKLRRAKVAELQRAMLQKAVVAPGEIGSGTLVIGDIRSAGPDLNLQIEIPFNGDVHKLLVRTPHGR